MTYKHFDKEETSCRGISSIALLIGLTYILVMSWDKRQWVYLVLRF